MSTKYNEDKFLKTLFNEAAEEPSPDFAKLLMEKVEQENRKNKFLYTPVIGWKGWSVFTSCFLATLFFGIKANSDESFKGLYDQLNGYEKIYSSINIFQAAPLIYIGVVAAAILIVIDFFINKNNNPFEKQS